jgi:hypothetical protein
MKPQGGVMLNKIGKFMLMMLVAVWFFGCAQHPVFQPESELDKNWGRSFESARHNQILNPDAGKNLEPVEGLEGPAAERIMNDYVNGGKQKKQESSSEFGVVTIKR